jgi:hypothetical protein
MPLAIFRNHSQSSVIYVRWSGVERHQIKLPFNGKKCDLVNDGLHIDWFSVTPLAQSFA